MESFATLAGYGPREWQTELRRQFDRIPTNLLILAPALAFALPVLITNSWALRGFAGDLELYRSYGFRFVDGLTLYSSVRMEYPPLSIIPMIVPLVGFRADDPNAITYLWRFMGVAGLIAAAAGWAIYRATGGDRLALATWGAMLALSWISAALRLDAWPVALTLVALLVARRHPGLAGVALGLGTMLKVYPFVLVGILAARAIASREWGGTARLVAGWALVCAAAMGWAWSIAGPDSLHWLAYQADRGLQVESIGASFVLAAMLLGAHAEPVFGFGSTQIVGPGSDVLVAISTPMLGIMAGAAGLLSLRRFVLERRATGTISMESVALACTAGVLALLLGNKVLSLQYILWLAPFVPFLPWRLRLLAMAIAGLSTWIFEVDYAGVWEFRWWMVVAMIARNVLLVWFAGLVVRAIWRVQRRTEADPHAVGRPVADGGGTPPPAGAPLPDAPLPHAAPAGAPLPDAPLPHAAPAGAAPAVASRRDPGRRDAGRRRRGGIRGDRRLRPSRPGDPHRGVGRVQDLRRPLAARGGPS